MKKMFHKILMAIIPWKIWSWEVTKVFMRLNYWVDKENLDKLTERVSDSKEK